MKNVVLIIFIIFSVILLAILVRQALFVTFSDISVNQPYLTITPTARLVVPPIAQFKSRITKKFFGTYVTPENSPVSPERFSGYHTGVDVEYSDKTTDIAVIAIADGQVVVSETAAGYGGVMIIRHTINNITYYGIYGHLRPASMLNLGTNVSQGDQIALLGTAYSSETDGERRHLHFGIAYKNTILGYVANKDDLSAWLDPLSFY